MWKLLHGDVSNDVGLQVHVSVGLLRLHDLHSVGLDDTLTLLLDSLLLFTLLSSHLSQLVEKLLGLLLVCL